MSQLGCNWVRSVGEWSLGVSSLPHTDWPCCIPSVGSVGSPGAENQNESFTCTSINSLWLYCLSLCIYVKTRVQQVFQLGCNWVRSVGEWSLGVSSLPHTDWPCCIPSVGSVGSPGAENQNESFTCTSINSLWLYCLSLCIYIKTRVQQVSQLGCVWVRSVGEWSLGVSSLPHTDWPCCIRSVGSVGSPGAENQNESFTCTSINSLWL